MRHGADQNRMGGQPAVQNPGSNLFRSILIVSKVNVNNCMKSFFLFVTLACSLITVARAQLKPEELTPDSYVKIVLNDSSQFYAIVLARPLPDRIAAETRYGRLEIPLAAIAYAIDYRWNYVKK